MFMLLNELFYRKMDEVDVTEWTCADVERWLTHNGFQQYTDLLCYQHKIDGQVRGQRTVFGKGEKVPGRASSQKLSITAARLFSKTTINKVIKDI